MDISGIQGGSSGLDIAQLIFKSRGSDEAKPVESTEEETEVTETQAAASNTEIDEAANSDTEEQNTDPNLGTIVDETV